MKKLKKLPLFLLVAALMVACLVVPAGAETTTGGYTVTPVAGTGGTTQKDTLVMNKTLSADVSTLTLEAYVTGEYKTETVTKGVPTDFVIIVDQSGSMAKNWSNETIFSWTIDKTSRLNSLQNALNSFLSMVQEKNTDTNGETLGHRIAMVGFANGDDSDLDDFGETYAFNSGEYYNTELFNGAEQIGYSNLTTAHYQAAFKDVETQADTIKKSIEAIDAQGCTYPSYGFYMAQQILVNDSMNADTSRNRVVIFFTDGYPGFDSGDNDTSEANEVLTAASALKASGVTVYTVGFSADGNTNFETYMKSVATNDDMFIKGDNATALEAAFKTTTNVIGGSSTTSGLDSTTELRDVLTPQFVVNGTPTIEVYDNAGSGTFSYNETASAALAAQNTSPVSADGTTISVTGFDYAKNYVVDEGSTARGQKIVVTIPITVRDGFLGGNNVPTNDTASGIYYNDKLENAFAVPYADVSIPAVTVTAQDKNVYLTGGLTAADMKTNATVTVGSATLDVSATAVNYGLQAWQNAYVDITYSDPAALSDLTEDTTYALTCTVSPKTSGTVAPVPGTSNAVKVNVFKPTLTFPEYTVYLGGTVPTFNYNSIEWKHDAAVGNILGSKPTLTVTGYTQSSGFTDCTDVSMTSAQIGDTDVTSHVSANQFKVHVLKPTVTFKDSTIYLGQTPNYTNNTIEVTWACGDGKAGDDNGSLIITGYAPESSEFDGCTKVSVTETEIGAFNATEYTTFAHNVTKPGEYEFTVHVVKPNVATSDVTIYYGNSTDLTKRVDNTDPWTCADGESMNASGAPEINYSFSEGNTTLGNTTFAPDNCTEVTVSGTVNGKSFTISDSTFMVHVLHPVITSDDTTIYLGQSANLNSCMTVAGTWVDKNVASNALVSFFADHGTANLDTTVKPTVAYTFMANPVVSDATKYFTETCTPVTVTATVTGTAGTKSAAIAEGEEKFTVHVLTSDFVVTTNNLWADYNTVVDLYDDSNKNAVASIAHSWVYTGSCSNHTAYENLSDEVKGAAPEITVTDVDFVDVGESWTMKADDDNKVVTVLNVDYKSGENSYTLTFAESDRPTATLHVNKFDLTINKTWTGADTYKQSAIFNVSGSGDPRGAFQVVVPADKASVTITGLLCGQSYSVTEDGNWCWRYDVESGAKTVTAHPHEISATAPTNHGNNNTVSFENTLNNTKWLSGEAYAINNATGRIDVTPTSVWSMIFKKEGE